MGVELIPIHKSKRIRKTLTFISPFSGDLVASFGVVKYRKSEGLLCFGMTGSV